MATVKYTGPIASFHCPTDAEIRHLKVHFSPKQEGTGDPSPENVRPIVGWDGVEVYNCSKPYASTTTIPDEYKKVEYLESTGTQYIYTNIPGKSGVECKAKVSWIEGGSGDACIFGARKYVSDRIMLIHQYPLHNWTIGNGNSYTGLSWIDYDVPYFVEAKTAIGEQYLKINGNVIYTGTDTTEYINNFNLSIFACTRESANNVTLFSKARVYYLTAYINNNVVLNVIPCIRKSDNKPGMYDTVSQTFLTNAGTGEFLYGPEVSGYTADYEFGILGKNKFDKSQSVDGRIMKANGTNYTADSGYYISPFIPVVVGASYTKNSPIIDAYHRFATYSSDNVSTFIRILDTSNTITIEPNEKYIRFCGKITEIDTAQLELGSTATAYEPYNPNHTVYGGWVDLITGEVCEEWYKIIYDGVTNVVNRGTYSENDYFGGAVVYLDPDGLASNQWEASNLYADRICPRAPSETTEFPYLRLISAGKQYIRFNIFKKSDYETMPSSAEVINMTNSWLQEHPVTIVYKLVTPNIYQLHPTELSTFLGQNNVWSNADYVEVEYDLHETQIILQRKQYILANQPHLVTAQDKLVNFHSDFAAPLKNCKVNFEPKQDLHGYDSVWIGGNGKNLFNPNLTQQNPSNTTTSPSTARIFTEGTYCVGTSWSNYYVQTNVYMYEVTSDHITVQNGNVYGVGVVCKLTPNETYSLSATTTNGRATVIFYDVDGTYISGIANSILGSNFTVPSNADITVINFYGPDNGDAATFTNIQLELGSTATSYAPYENICPIEGWNNLSITHNNDIVFKPIEETRTETYRNVSVENIPNGIRVINTNNSSYNSAVWYAPCSNYVNKQLKISLTCDFTGGGAGRLYVTANAHDGSTLQSLVQSTIIKGQPFREWTIIPPDGTEYLRICLFASDVETMGYGKYTDYINMYITPIENVPQIIPIKFPTLGKNKFNPNMEWTVGTPYRYAYLPELEQDCVMSFTLKDSTIDVSDVSIGFAYSKPTSSAEANKGYRWCMSNGVIKTYEKINRVKETNDTSNADKLCTYIMIISNTDDAYSRLLAAYDIQIEYGSTPTSYEPYNDTIYGGYVDLLTGEAWQEWAEKDLGSLSYYISSSQYGSFATFDLAQSNIFTTRDTKANMYIDNITVVDSTTFNLIPSQPGCYAHCGDTNNTIYIMSPDFIGITVEELKTILSGHKIVYKLATPVLLTTLTPTQLKSLKGVNNIWSDANGNVEVSYWSH